MYIYMYVGIYIYTYMYASYSISAFHFVSLYIMCNVTHVRAMTLDFSMLGILA